MANESRLFQSSVDGIGYEFDPSTGFTPSPTILPDRNLALFNNQFEVGLRLGHSEEVISWGSGSLTADSVANLVPAPALIICTLARVTALGASWVAGTTLSVGTPTTADRFQGALAGLGTLGTQFYGVNFYDPTKTAAYTPVSQAPAKIRLTSSVAPTSAAGRVRVVVFYWLLAAPLS